jgi:hypothetical protein
MPIGFVIVDLSRLQAGLIAKRAKNKIIPTQELQKHFLEGYFILILQKTA